MFQDSALFLVDFLPVITVMVDWALKGYCPSFLTWPLDFSVPSIP